MAQSHIRTRSSMSAAAATALPDLDDPEFKERVLFALRHQIRPAEEVDAVRRAMAGNLARALGRSQLANPLALLDRDRDTAPATATATFEGDGGAAAAAAADPDLVLSTAQREFLEAARTGACLLFFLSLVVRVCGMRLCGFAD